jgi:phospholipase D1/2
MAGKPFKVGRFAHTLRVRLMREHLGVDVDSLDEEALIDNDAVQPECAEKTWDSDTEQVCGREEGVTHIKRRRHPVGAAVGEDTLDGARQGGFRSRIFHVVLIVLL